MMKFMVSREMFLGYPGGSDVLTSVLIVGGAGEVGAGSRRFRVREGEMRDIGMPENLGGLWKLEKARRRILP